MIKILQYSFTLFALFISGALQAQDTLLVELFDDSTLGLFSGFSEVGDGESWGAADFNEKYFAQMNGFNGGVQENVDWLISPGIDMGSYNDETLTFENASNFSGPDLELLVSTDYIGTGDPNAATWTDISDQAMWSPGEYQYVESGAIDLSMFEDTAYIAFKYTSSPELAGKLYQIDAIVVSGTPTGTNIGETKGLELLTTPYVSNDQLVFSTNDLLTRISISTINGQLVNGFSNKQVQGDISIPVGHLAVGVYVLIAESEGVMMSYKFVK